MEISAERELIDKGRDILESYLDEVQKTPGYLGWRIVETVDFLPHADKEIERRCLYLLVSVDGDANAKNVAEYLEEIEDKAMEDFSNIFINENIDGSVRIFIFMDNKEDN